MCRLYEPAYDAFNRQDIPAVLATYDEAIEWTEGGGGRARRQCWLMRLESTDAIISVAWFASTSWRREQVFAPCTVRSRLPVAIVVSTRSVPSAASGPRASLGSTV
jgi:hypothetical protein